MSLPVEVWRPQWSPDHPTPHLDGTDTAPTAGQTPAHALSKDEGIRPHRDSGPAPEGPALGASLSFSEWKLTIASRSREPNSPRPPSEQIKPNGFGLAHLTSFSALQLRREVDHLERGQVGGR